MPKYDYTKDQKSLHYHICQEKGCEGRVHWAALVRNNDILYFQRVLHSTADVAGID